MDHPPLPSHTAMAIGAGFLTGIFYLLSLNGSIFSFLLPYLPYVPLFAIGFAHGHRMVGIAALAALLLIAGLHGITAGLLFLFLCAVPSWFFVHTSLLRLLPGMQVPVGGALTGLSLYAAILLFTVTMVLYNNGVDFSSFLSLDESAPAWMEQAKTLIVERPFVVLAMAASMHLFMIYGTAVLVNFLLNGWQLSQRKNLALEPFMPSPFVLISLIGFGLASFSETTAVQLAAKTGFLVLLIPYFLMGIAQMHLRSRRWPYRYGWLTAVYVLMALAFFPVFWFIASGLYLQAKFLSNRYA